MHDIKKDSYHLKLYREGNGNFEFALRTMLHLQAQFISIEQKDSSLGYTSVSAYADFYDIMNRELEEFRSKMIYNQTVEDKERTCLFSKIIR